MECIIIGVVAFITGALFGIIISSLLVAASWEDESKQRK